MSSVTLAQARKNHEEMAEMLGMNEEDREEAWLLAVETYRIEYPPGPTPEQEKKMMELGRIVSQYIP